MKYIIYELIEPEHLRRHASDGYGYTKTVYRQVLEKLDVSNVEPEHSTIEEAVAHIHQHKAKLKHLILTVLPVFEINWEGEVR